MTQKKKSGRIKAGESPSERAFHRLGLLDCIISAVERAKSEHVLRVKGSVTDEARSDAFRDGCSIQLSGHEASYLLKCLRAARAGDKDPFAVAGTFRANAGLSTQEQVVIAREVQTALDCGLAGSILAAVEIVSKRHPLGEDAVAAMYGRLKDFI
jgi:hypothetical protein